MALKGKKRVIWLQKTIKIIDNKYFYISLNIDITKGGHFVTKLCKYFYSNAF